MRLYFRQYPLNPHWGSLFAGVAGGDCGEHAFGELCDFGGAGGAGGAFEDWEPGFGGGAIGGDDAHSGWGEMAGVTGATGSANEAADDCDSAAAGITPESGGIGKAVGNF